MVQLGLQPGTAEGESIGVQIGFGLAALAAVLGIVMSFSVLRAPTSDPPHEASVIARSAPSTTWSCVARPSNW